jgi:hypothetical protein
LVAFASPSLGDEPRGGRDAWRDPGRHRDRELDWLRGRSRQRAQRLVESALGDHTSRQTASDVHQLVAGGEDLIGQRGSRDRLGRSAPRLEGECQELLLRAVVEVPLERQSGRVLGVEGGQSHPGELCEAGSRPGFEPLVVDQEGESAGRGL